MSGKNMTNVQVNKMIKRKDYKRVGRCTDCRSVCCNFISLGPWWTNNRTLVEYWQQHGELVVDRWWRIPYVIVRNDCHSCTEEGKCELWKSQQMPEACRQFPVSPWDTVWRYLKQINVRCGYDFVDRKTGKRWDMRRLPPEASYKTIEQWEKSEVTP